MQAFSKEQYGKIDVCQPYIVQFYKQHMGDVDLLDANIGRSKIDSQQKVVRADFFSIW